MKRKLLLLNGTLLKYHKYGKNIESILENYQYGGTNSDTKIKEKNNAVLKSVNNITKKLDDIINKIQELHKTDIFGDENKVTNYDEIKKLLNEAGIKNLTKNTFYNESINSESEENYIYNQLYKQWTLFSNKTTEKITNNTIIAESDGVIKQFNKMKNIITKLKEKLNNDKEKYNIQDIKYKNTDFKADKNDTLNEKKIILKSDNIFKIYQLLREVPNIIVLENLLTSLNKLLEEKNSQYSTQLIQYIDIMKTIHILGKPVLSAGSINNMNNNMLSISGYITEINELFDLLQNTLDNRNKAKRDYEYYILYLLSIIILKDIEYITIYTIINKNTVVEYFNIIKDIQIKITNKDFDNNIKIFYNRYNYVLNILYIFTEFMINDVFINDNKSIIIEECRDNVKFLFSIFNHFKNILDKYNKTILQQ